MSADEAREALARTIAEVTDQWDEPLDEVHDIPQIVNALFASGLISEGTATEDWGVRVLEGDPDYIFSGDFRMGRRYKAETVICRAPATRKLIHRTVTDWEEVQ